MLQKSLSLIITKKCTAACDICCFSCSPNNEEKMLLEDAINYIDQASEIEQFSSVGVSGGEPFIYFNDLVEISKHCQSRSLNFSCSTNSFWADTIENTRFHLKTLTDIGYVLLSLSIDEFHAQYVPFENVRNVLRVAKEFPNLSIALSCVCTKNSKRLKDVLEYIGDDIMGYCAASSPCLPVGNAETCFKPDDFFIDDNSLNNKCSGLSSLVIMPDGNAYPCCYQGGFTPALYLGSAKELPIGEIIKNFNGNMYCRTLENHGVKWFIDKICENNLPINLKSSYVCICDVCYTLFRNPEYHKYYEPFLDIEMYNIIQNQLEKDAVPL